MQLSSSVALALPQYKKICIMMYNYRFVPGYILSHDILNGTLIRYWAKQFSTAASCFSMASLDGITVPVKYVWCGSLNLSSVIFSKCLNAGSSTTLRDCNPRQIKSSVPSTLIWQVFQRVWAASTSSLWWKHCLVQGDHHCLAAQVHDTPVRDSVEDGSSC